MQRTPITALNLSRRAQNRLMFAGISDIETLEQKSERDLLQIKELGRKTLQEIIAALVQYWGENHAS